MIQSFQNKRHDDAILFFGCSWRKALDSGFLETHA
jgi:hypothetical protein